MKKEDEEQNSDHPIGNHDVEGDPDAVAERKSIAKSQSIGGMSSVGCLSHRLQYTVNPAAPIIMAEAVGSCPFGSPVRAGGRRSRQFGWFMDYLARAWAIFFPHFYDISKQINKSQKHQLSE